MPAPTERDAAKEAHQKDEKHGLLITKDAKAKPPCPPTKKLRSQAFILDQMRHSMKFFSPERAIDESGGYFHFSEEDGSIFDQDTKVLIDTKLGSSSRSPYCRRAPERPEVLKAVEHGVSYLARGLPRNTENGAYHWALKDGNPHLRRFLLMGWPSVCSPTLLLCGRAAKWHALPKRDVGDA